MSESVDTTVFDVIDKEFQFPFPPYDYQHRALTKAVDFNKLLFPLKVGRGKTPLSTWRALYDSVVNGIEHVIIIVPASLVIQWSRWLAQIKFSDGDDLQVVTYLGTPTKRKAMDVAGADFIVLSHQIFVNDYARFRDTFMKNSKVHVIYDESQDGLRKPGNKIWRLFRNFTLNKPITLLSGTPVSTPGDVYGVVKLLDPQVYPSKRNFTQQHVAEEDYFGNITAWKGLDILKANLYKNAVIVPDSELNELPGLIVDKVEYDLTPKHRKLYDELVKEQLLNTDSGEVLDATETNRMFHTLQRFVTSPDRMDFKKVQAELLNCLWTIYNEDDSKIIIFAYYTDTNESILDFFLKKKVNAVGVWGKQSRTQKQENLDGFMQDPDVRVLVGNWNSMGVGTNGLQDVCFREVFAELPLTPPRCEQATGRIDREGQTEKCIAKFLVATGTIQESLFYSYQTKDDLLQQITEGRTTMKEMLSRN